MHSFNGNITLKLVFDEAIAFGPFETIVFLFNIFIYCIASLSVEGNTNCCSIFRCPSKIYDQ